MLLSPLEQAITDHLGAVFGCPLNPGHRINDGHPAIYIGTVRDYPAENMVTLSTVGVSNYLLYLEDGSIYAATRVEFIASCQEHEAADMALALGNAARLVSKVRGFVRPGIFLFDLIGQFRRESTVPHGLLITPFAYPGLKEHGPFGETIVSWLQVIPVSTSEIDFAKALSSDALIELFIKEDIDWDRLDRTPVI